MFQTSVDELSIPEVVFQIGIAPQRIDVMTSVSGIEFDDAWPHRLVADLDGVQADVIGREQLQKKQTRVGTGTPQRHLGC